MAVIPTRPYRNIQPIDSTLIDNKMSVNLQG